MNCLPYYTDYLQQIKNTWLPATLTEKIGLTTFPGLANDREVIVFLHPPVRQISPHYHDFFESVYIYRGSCINQIDGSSYPMQEGDLCILNSRAVHALEVPHPEQTYIFNILVGRSIVDDAFFRLLSSEDAVASFFLNSLQTQNAENNHILFHRTGSEGTYEAIAQKIIEEYANPQIYQKEALYFSFISLLIELARSHKHEINQTGSSYALSEILQFTSDHCSDISIASLAEHFNYHPKYIPSLIRKYTGQSFTELLTDIRLKKAAGLLSQTQMPVSQIIEAVGYSNRSWFLRKFKEKFGCTPLQYRQSHS